MTATVPSSVMRVPELAGRLGISVDTFYRTRARRERQDGLPKPLCSGGRHVWDRASVEAWLSRHHPLAPSRAAANDAAPPIVPADAQAVNAFVAAHYGWKSPAGAAEEP